MPCSVWVKGSQIWKKCPVAFAKGDRCLWKGDCVPYLYPYSSDVLTQADGRPSVSSRAH